MAKNRIRELRKEKNFTQTQLAENLGITQESVSAYEHGTYEPSFGSLRKMADLLDASMDYIMGLSTIRERAPEPEVGFDPQKELLNRCYRRLGDKNKVRLVSYAQGLLDSEQ